MLKNDFAGIFFFTCYADIVNIETEFGCQLFKWKVKQQNNMFWCNSCNSESQFPMPRWPNCSLLILYKYDNDCIGK